MASSDRQWPPSEAELANDLAKIVTVRVGYPLRGKATADALAAVVAQLSNDPTLTTQRQIEDVVSESIRRMATGGFAKAAAQLFGVDPETADMRTVADRRRIAADTLGVEESTFKEREPRMCTAIAEDLLNRLPPDCPPPVGYGEPQLHQDQSKPSCVTGASRSEGWRSSKRGPALVSLALVLIGATLLAIQPWGEAGAATHAELARLTTEAERPLSLAQTPLPGTTSSVLGFGDALGGRKTYQYVNSTPVPDYPILDSFIDSPEHVGDERMFLKVETGPKRYAHRPQWVKPAADARSHDLVFAHLYIANDAPEEPNCNKLEGPTVATNARFRVTVWNSSNEHVHVIRAWISADNASPPWITDAAAVITSTTSPLSFDPEDSWQYAISPSQFATEAPLPNQDFFDAGGMALSSNGLLGSCWANRWSIVLAFHQ